MPLIDGSLEDLAKDLAKQIFDTVKTTFGNAWDSVKAEVKAVLSEVSLDAGVLAIRSMRGEDTAEEKLHIDAQLLNLKVAGEILAVRTFWEAFGKVLEVVGTALGVLGKAALKSATGFSI